MGGEPSRCVRNMRETCGHVLACIGILKLQVCHCRMYDLLKERQFRLVAKRKGKKQRGLIVSDELSTMLHTS